MRWTARGALRSALFGQPEQVAGLTFNLGCSCFQPNCGQPHFAPLLSWQGLETSIVISARSISVVRSDYTFPSPEHSGEGREARFRGASRREGSRLPNPKRRSARRSNLYRTRKVNAASLAEQLQGSLNMERRHATDIFSLKILAIAMSAKIQTSFSQSSLRPSFLARGESTNEDP